MHISIDTENLSPLDYQVLALLGGVATAPKAEAEKATTPAAAKKATPAKKTAAPKPAPAPEPEPEEEDEDLVGGDDEGYSLEDAVSKATAMVADGQAAEVKAALTKVGAKKVSALEGDQIAAFMAEVG